MGESQGRRSVVSNRKPVSDNLHWKNKGGGGTVGSAAADFRGVRKEEWI